MILNILYNASVSSLRANTRADLQDVLHTAVTSLGFDSFNLSCGKADKREFMTAPTLTNWSVSDRQQYNQDGLAERDPILTYAAGQGDVLSWKTSDWHDEEYKRVLEDRGLKGGVTAPLTIAPGPLAGMTVLSSSRDEFDIQAVRALPLLGNIAVMRAHALGLAESNIPLPPTSLATLSERQMEILRWAAQGKSNGDIAEIISQKKRTVEYHMNIIIKKLGVSTKLQAANLYSCANIDR